MTARENSQQPSRIRVLMLMSELGYGGAETSFLRVAYYLSAHTDVTIADLGGGYEESSGYRAVAVETAHPIVMLGGGRKSAGGHFGKLQKWRCIRRDLVEVKARHDVTISCLSGPNLLNAIFGDPARAIVSERGSKRHDISRSSRSRLLWTRGIDPLAYNRAARIVAASEGLAREISDANPGARDRVFPISGSVLTKALLAASEGDVDEKFAWLADKSTIVAMGQKEEMDVLLVKRVVNRLGRPFGVNPFPRAFPNPIEGRARSAAKVFNEISRGNFWGSGESLSGLGSEIAFTQTYRAALARCLTDRGSGPSSTRLAVIRIGCRSSCPNTLPTIQVATSRPRSLPARATHPGRDLRVFDITADSFPEADLWHCRDCLFHLPFDAIRQALASFAASGIGHALITSDRARLLHRNLDVGLGGFRFLDLEPAPFFLPPPLARIPDCRRGHDFPPLCLPVVS